MGRATHPSFSTRATDLVTLTRTGQWHDHAIPLWDSLVQPQDPLLDIVISAGSNAIVENINRQPREFEGHENYIARAKIISCTSRQGDGRHNCPRNSR